MKELNGWNTISGKEGRAYAKIDGNNEEMFSAKSVEATVEKSKGQVKAIGKRMVGHKTTGAEGTGSMTLYYLSPLFRSKLSEWKMTGVDAYFDMLIENTDPENLFIELDVYWAVMGKASPVDYFHKYPGRFKMLHIKDRREIGQSGMVGFDAIFENAKTAGVENIIVEVEQYSYDVEKSVKLSLDYLLEAPFVKASYSK